MDSNIVWKCPACGLPQSHPCDECPQCGVIVARYNKRKEHADAAPVKEKDQQPAVHAEPEVTPDPPTEKVKGGTRLRHKVKYIYAVGAVALIVLVGVFWPIAEDHPTMLKACRKGWLPTVERLTVANQDLMLARDGEGNNTLGVAAMNQREKVIVFLLNHLPHDNPGNYVNNKNALGESALSHAVEKGNVAIVKSLLSRGSQVDEKIVIKAIKQDRTELVRVLLEAVHHLDVVRAAWSDEGAVLFAPKEILDLLEEKENEILAQLKEQENLRRLRITQEAFQRALQERQQWERDLEAKERQQQLEARQEQRLREMIEENRRLERQEHEDRKRSREYFMEYQRRLQEIECESDCLECLGRPGCDHLRCISRCQRKSLY